MLKCSHGTHADVELIQWNVAITNIPGSMKFVRYSGRRYSSCGRVSGRIQDGIRALEVRPLVMSFTCPGLLHCALF